MKRSLFFMFILVISLLSCKNKTNIPPLKSTNLKSAFIELFPDSAYLLKMPKGAIIKIEKNSFKASGKVRLEVKEAYSLQDMLLAGLVTESNGKLLNSAGMIYINATEDNKQVELQKPIKISLPGKSYDGRMKLFDGELNDDSTINWVNPQALDTSPALLRSDRGKQLFIANCSSCHKPDKDFTAPLLAGCRDREPDRDWAYRFTREPFTMYETNDYAKALFSKWNKTEMTAFPLLNKEDVDAILDYCDNTAPQMFSKQMPPVEAKTDSLPMTTSEIPVPCFVNDTIYQTPANNNLIQVLNNDTDLAIFSAKTGNSKAEDLESLRGGFTDPVQSGLYEFSIETFGWFNVDAFVEGYLGTTYVKVNVSLQMQYEADMHIYLFCPDKKMLSVSNVIESGIYSFNKIDGKVPLFLNDKAVLLAFGSKEDKMFYGTVSFNIRSEQTMTIKIKETSLKELKSFIELNKMDGIKIDAAKNEMVYKQESPSVDPVPVEIDVIQVPCTSDSTKKK